MDDEEQQDKADGDGEFGGGPEGTAVCGTAAPGAVVDDAGDDRMIPHAPNDRGSSAK
ncbi:hypothetical protein SGFS_047960 [Streptomyces graminofaciens]|uniref:Uncharacterized protein n=1 Tax=Streptomyces graminofaciens TaxID=68212 RepID=A0ABM7FBJ2_9ACTN|nr:hypothetical protein SGFS_047960 [Streptomyces graminofaciens]